MIRSRRAGVIAAGYDAGDEARCGADDTLSGCRGAGGDEFGLASVGYAGEDGRMPGSNEHLTVDMSVHTHDRDHTGRH